MEAVGSVFECEKEEKEAVLERDRMEKIGKISFKSMGDNGMINENELELLFYESVPVMMKSDLRETKIRDLTIKIERQCARVVRQGLKNNANNLNSLNNLNNLDNLNKCNGDILSILVTDEMDPFFLYSQQVCETDFHLLKREQSLLVDFYTFPKHLIQLLKNCLQCKEKKVNGINGKNEKYVAVMCLSKSKSANEIENGNEMANIDEIAQLCVQETNEFRHLQHVSIDLIAGNDEKLKQYLAKTLMALKRENEKLTLQLNQVSNKLNKTENDKHSNENEFNQIIRRKDEELRSLTTQHSLEIRQIHENSLKQQKELQVKYGHDCDKLKKR